MAKPSSVPVCCLTYLPQMSAHVQRQGSQIDLFLWQDVFRRSEMAVLPFLFHCRGLISLPPGLFLQRTPGLQKVLISFGTSFLPWHLSARTCACVHTSSLGWHATASSLQGAFSSPGIHDDLLGSSVHCAPQVWHAPVSDTWHLTWSYGIPPTPAYLLDERGAWTEERWSRTPKTQPLERWCLQAQFCCPSWRYSESPHRDLAKEKEVNEPEKFSKTPPWGMLLPHCSQAFMLTVHRLFTLCYKTSH